MADIEKTISTKVEKNYLQRDCEKIVSEKKNYFFKKIIIFLENKKAI